MIGDDRLLMEGHYGRMRSNICHKLQQGRFLTGHAVFTVESGKALEIASHFQNFGRQGLEQSASFEVGPALSGLKQSLAA